jgi:Family of unknown function (DUF6464)
MAQNNTWVPVQDNLTLTIIGWGVWLSGVIFLAICDPLSRYLIHTTYSRIAERTRKSKSMAEEVGEYILICILCVMEVAAMFELLMFLLKTLGTVFLVLIYLVGYSVGQLLISHHKIAQKAVMVDRERQVDSQSSSISCEDPIGPSCDFDISWDEVDGSFDNGTPSSGLGVFMDEWDEANDSYYDNLTAYGIGDLTCVYNARSPLLRCAVNPYVECEDCQHYESIKIDS